jgi:TRAP-type C4-dicarboxylate transport system permease small subunit
MTEPLPLDKPTGAARALSLLATASTAIAGIALVALVSVQAWQVFARYVLNDSPSWTEPVTVLLLVSAMSFGAAAGVHGGRHFAFALLADALSPPLRRLTATMTHLVIAVIGGTLAHGGFKLLVDGFGIRLAGAPLPQSLVFLPLAIGGVLMLLFALQRLAQAWRVQPAAKDV